MHRGESIDVYNDPDMRLVYGLRPLPSRLHRLCSADGTIWLVSMTDAQCNRLLENQRDTDYQCTDFSVSTLTTTPCLM